MACACPRLIGLDGLDPSDMMPGSLRRRGLCVYTSSQLGQDGRMDKFVGQAFHRRPLKAFSCNSACLVEPVPRLQAHGFPWQANGAQSAGSAFLADGIELLGVERG